MRSRSWSVSTLPSRKGWLDLSLGLRPSDIDLGKFDRPWSLIDRRLLLALEDAQDPRLAVSPMLVADATLYALSGLMDGSLNERYWLSCRGTSVRRGTRKGRRRQFSKTNSPPGSAPSDWR